MTVVLKRIDGPELRCSFETWDCSSHAALAGGFDEHHRWPKTMGGPETTADLLILCPTHHRRQHALIRAYVQYGTSIRTVRWFSTLEKATARYAVEQWKAAGAPRIYWNVPAAAVITTT